MNYVVVRGERLIGQALDSLPQGESVGGRDATVTEQVHQDESGISHHEH